MEDDKIRRENTKELLEFSNFKVITAVNGKEGRKIGYGLKPDIVLCDILMPWCK
ncbi:response regulator [Salegentibacter salinarum]|uniref:response regulator n=1 Tax=Salegentibacter salinarum TaxID=447422 RepID=UPI0037428359